MSACVTSLPATLHSQNAYPAVEEARREAQAALARGDFEVAQAALERGVELADAQENEQALGDLNFYLGVVSQEQKNFRRAEGYYRQTLSLRPGSAAALNNLALVYVKQGKYQPAAESLQEAVRREQNVERRALYLANYADVLVSTGDVDAAEKEVRRAGRLSPDNTDIQTKIISFYLEHDRGSLGSYLWELLESGRIVRAEKAALDLLARSDWNERRMEMDQILNELLTIVTTSLSQQYYNPSEFSNSETSEVLQQLTHKEEIGEGASEIVLLHSGTEFSPSAYHWWAARGEESHEAPRGFWPRDAFRILARSLGDRFVGLERHELAEEYYRLAAFLWPGQIDPEALLDLADLYVSTERHGSLEELVHRFERSLFRGKGEAYSSSYWRKIFEFHKTLGIIYGHLRYWGDSGTPTSAIFQLEHALRAAERYNQQITAESDQQLTAEPRLYHLLAVAYGETGQELRGFGLRLEAAEKYLKSGDRESARDVLIPGERWQFTIPSSAPASLMRRYRELTELLTAGARTVVDETMPVAVVPADSRIVSPDVAFPGGRIVGRVVSPAGRPVPNAPVKVTSITGRVVDTRTDEKGAFTVPVPDVPAGEAGTTGEILRLAAGAAESVVTRLLQPDDEDVPREPPRYIQHDSKIHIRGDYPEVALEDPAIPERGEQPADVADAIGEPDNDMVHGDATAAQILAETGHLPLPTAYAIGPGGQPVVTAFEMPAGIPPGDHVFVFEDPAGRTHRYEADVYHMVRAGIDQETLHSGQEAEFFFEYDFGPGPERTVSLEVTAGGAIEYAKSGIPQVLEIDQSGYARFSDSVRALQGTPTGAPFTIDASIEERN